MMPGSGLQDPGAAAAGAVAMLAVYLCITGIVSYFRNPLRGPHWSKQYNLSEQARKPPGRSAKKDVSAAAARGKIIAVIRFAVQIAGFGITAYALLLFRVRPEPGTRFWYVYLIAGLVTCWLAGKLIRPPGVVSESRRWRIRGPRQIRVLGMLSLGSVLIVTGTLFVLTYGLETPDPSAPDGPGLVDSTPASDAETTSTQMTGFEGIALLALGAIAYRHARRLGTLDARALMGQDTRPPILYLRSFGDDRLRLWTATLGRQSLIERLSFRRFDLFEDVLARHLSVLGPVIAVNPPGSALPPLGAARATLDTDDWQSAVAGWMEHAARVVFVAPPGQIGPGLRWELETVSARGYWDKTLIVTPPVRPLAIRDRWESFQAAFEDLGILRPSDEHRTLILAHNGGEWTAFTANSRSEWSYGAALNAATGTGPVA